MSENRIDWSTFAFAIVMVTFLGLITPKPAHGAEINDVVWDGLLSVYLYSTCPDKPNDELIQKFSNLVKTNAELNQRKGWIADQVQFLKTCARGIEPGKLGIMLGATVALINEVGREAAIELIRSIFTDADLPLSQSVLSAIPVIETAESLCPNLSLLNEETGSSVGPLRMTSQTFGNCYVHSAVRAIDYDRYVRKEFQIPISIAGTSVEANVSRYGSKVSQIDSGFESDIVNHLASSGGCPLNELDEDGEGKLKWLEDFYQDLFASEEDLLKLPRLTSAQLNEQIGSQGRESLEKILDWAMGMVAISSKWRPTTMNVVNQALVTERALAKKVVDSRSPVPMSLINDFSKKIMQLTDEFQNPKKYQHEFLRFANLVLKKTYCSQSRIPIRPYSVTLKWKSDGFRNFNQAIRNVLEQQKPVMASICTEVFTKKDKDASCGRHAVLITGQRFNKKTETCEYQVLNSWGSDRSYYSQDLEFDSRFGSVWIPSERLKKFSRRLEALEPR